MKKRSLGALELRTWRVVECPPCKISADCGKGPGQLELCATNERLIYAHTPIKLLIRRAMRKGVQLKKINSLSTVLYHSPHVLFKRKPGIQSPLPREATRSGLPSGIFPQPAHVVFRGATLLCSNKEVFRECRLSK